MKHNMTKPAAVTFTRWSRHGWAAFRSLSLEVRIGVLAVGMLFGNVARAWADTSAQAAQADTLTLTELEVTVKRAYPPRGMVLPRTLISGKSMSELPLPTLEAALKIMPEIDVRERGGMSVQSDISLFGSSPDQSTIMLNGIDFTDARTGHQSSSLPIDPETVDKIMVATDIIGAGAYSGGINYVMRVPDSPYSISAKITGGDFSYWRAHAAAGASADIGSMLMSTSYASSHGYIANGDFNNLNLYAYAVSNPHIADIHVGQIEVQAGFQHREFGSPGFYSLKYPWQWERTQTFLSSARWHRNFGRADISAYAAYRRNTDLYALYREGIDAPDRYSGPNHHLTDNLQAGAQADWNWGRIGVTSAGIDITYNHIYSNVIGFDMDEPRPVKGYPGGFYKRSYHRTVGNYWLRQGLRISTRLSANISANLVTNPYGTRLMWGAAVEWLPADSWSLGISAGQTMRLPTFTDLFYTTATHVANVGIKPETARTVRLRTTWHTHLITLSASAFYRHGSDIIDWTKAADEDQWHVRQFNNINTLGASIVAGTAWQGTLPGSARLSYGYMHNSRGDMHGYMSEYDMSFLKHKLNAALTLKPYRGASITVMGTLFDRVGQYFDADNIEQPYKPYFLTDLSLQQRLKCLTLSLDINNIFNVRYYDYGGLRMPPRWFTASVAISI